MGVPAGRQEGKIFAKMQEPEELKRKKGPQPTKGMTFKKVGHKEEADNQILLKIFYQDTKS